ncbi:hypothetical protein [Salipiger mangrovisoli]|uniref:Beta-barrel porin 2 n=1 Tax=Salipiger mangrovisoli TaxID=2865933 RepID=A0ABR9XA05_9RHOB|nr:hypothetical protein [Salipiger mangrovisoli]MBE9640444.1 hypothetical protein [Salipiger mangrovisoli]
MRRVIGLLALTALLVGSLSPVAAQETGGRMAQVEVQQSLRVTRNPDLVAGASDTETLATTDLGYHLSSVTRDAVLSLRFGAQLLGDIGEGTFEVDHPSAALRYDRSGTPVALSARASLSRRDIGYLRPLELIELEDGSLVVPEDIDALNGTGRRSSSSLSLTAKSGRDGPTGWSVALRGGSLSYQDVESEGLRDSRRASVELGSHVDLSRTLQLRGLLGYELQDEEGSAQIATRSLSLDLFLRRPAGELRAGLEVARPDAAPDRVSLTTGLRRELGRTGWIDLDIGLTALEDDDTRVVAAFGLERQLSATSRVSAHLDRQVALQSGGETVLSTAARAGWSRELDRQTAFDLTASYSATDALGVGGRSGQVGLTAGLHRRLAQEWRLSIGAEATRRDAQGEDSATSGALFVTLGRDWSSRF